MTTFDDREKSFENKFAHDEQLRFKITSRRNRLFGLWAAEKLGKVGEVAEAYAKDVIVSDLEEPGDADIIGKVLADFEAAGLTFKKADIAYELNHLEGRARDDVMKG